jgi:hypothetical protein
MNPFLASESLGARNIAATATDRAMLMVLGMAAFNSKFYVCEYISLKYLVIRHLLFHSFQRSS